MPRQGSVTKKLNARVQSNSRTSPISKRCSRQHSSRWSSPPPIWAGTKHRSERTISCDAITSSTASISKETSKGPCVRSVATCTSRRPTRKRSTVVPSPPWAAISFGKYSPVSTILGPAPPSSGTCSRRPTQTPWSKKSPSTSCIPESCASRPTGSWARSRGNAPVCGEGETIDLSRGLDWNCRACTAGERRPARKEEANVEISA